MAKNEILDTYEQLKKATKAGFLSAGTADLLSELFERSAAFVQACDREKLTSKVEGKSYFRFTSGDKTSRAVNTALYSDAPLPWKKALAALDSALLPEDVQARITRQVYSAVISFCSAIDLLKSGDQKTPGTVFEYAIGFLISKQLDCEPQQTMPIMNADIGTLKLPTDLVFNLGEGKPRYHVPVKTSSRERSIMFWAHQRLLDGVYGLERYQGLPVLLAETKCSKSGVVTEICLPDQWKVYQTYIAKLRSIQYLDVPKALENLGETYPHVIVRPLGALLATISSGTDC